MSDTYNNISFSSPYKAEAPGPRSSREHRPTEAAALLWGGPGVWAHWDESGPGSPPGGTQGGGGHRRVPLWGQTEPVHPCPCTEDVLRWDPIWDGDRRGRMFPVQGFSRCVCRVYSSQTTFIPHRPVGRRSGTNVSGLYGLCGLHTLR